VLWDAVGGSEFVVDRVCVWLTLCDDVAGGERVRLPPEREKERERGKVIEFDPVLLLYVKCLYDHVLLILGLAVRERLCDCVGRETDDETVAVMKPQMLFSKTCPPNTIEVL
jgi:hypothetical protein